MKTRFVNAFALILAVAGIVMLAANAYYVLSGGGFYWYTIELLGNTTGHFSFRGWGDLQLGSKLHIVFAFKTVCLMVASAMIWIKARRRITREKSARWMLMIPVSTGLVCLIAAIAFWLMDSQEDVIFRNGATFNLVTTLFFLAIATFLVKVAHGIFNQDLVTYWMLAGFLIAAVSNEAANLLVVFAFPFLIDMQSVLAGWYLQLAVEVVGLLVLFSGALLLLYWLRSELLKTTAVNSDSSDPNLSLS